MLTLQHLAYIRRKDSKLGETIDDLRKALLSLGQQAGIGVGGPITPPQIQNIFVTATNGVFSITVTDKSLSHLGVNYFLEYADNAQFNNSHTLFLGPSHTENGLFLGSGTFYFRAFSQYLNSAQSPKVTYGGTTPLGVAGGGAIAGPTLPPTQGSGANGGGFGGFGTSPGQRAPNKT